MNNENTNNHTDSHSLIYSQRLQWLDILKALAMIGVILVHFNNIWPSPINILSKLNAVGAKCPQLFFIISAYLTWTALEKNGTNWKKFYIKRFIRIAPLFYIAIILNSIIPRFKMPDISLWNWLSHIFFLNGINPLWANTIMGIEWYIADLAIFYMLTPLLWKIANNLKHSVFILCCSVILSSLTLVIYNKFMASENLLIQMYFDTFVFIHQLPVIMMGITLFYLIKKLDDKYIYIWKYLLIFGITIICITMFFIILHLDKRFLTNSFIAGLIFSWLFLFTWSIRFFFEKNILKPFSFIGVHSFGIYCFHQLIINCTLAVVTQREICIWAMTLSMVILLSILIGYLMENIQEMLIKRFSK
ncbi:MAG: acyltransferase [Spirochaetaceae bacterium]|nr:acyltransferase [Spirochaetaceae bacterium]